MSSLNDKIEGLVHKHSLKDLQDLYVTSCEIEHPDEHALCDILWMALQVKRVRVAMGGSDGRDHKTRTSGGPIPEQGGNHE